MTVYSLKENHLQAEPNSHFFDYDTLKFFGERMSEMRVMKNTEHGKNSAIIGRVLEGEGTFIKTRLGATRRFDVLYGEGLPRIC